MSVISAGDSFGALARIRLHAVAVAAQPQMVRFFAETFSQ
jgi:hypothetical protein